MSQTSCVRHPAKARFLKIYQWQLDFCDGDACAAALMSYFEFCHNGKLQQLGQAKALNDALEQDPEGQGRSQAETLLQWHTTADLEKAILLYKRDKIAQAIKLLKVKGVIEVRPNPNPRLWFDRTQHFLFRPEVVNTWIDAHFPADPNSISDFSEMPGETPPSPSIVEKSEMHARKIGSGLRETGNDLEQRIRSKNTPKETTTTSAGAAPKAKDIRNPGNVVAASFGADQKTEDPSERQRVHSLIDGFGLTKGQEEEVMRFVQERGMPYLDQKVAIVRSKDRDNAAGALLKALRDDWPAPVSLKKAKLAPKAKSTPAKPELPAPTEDYTREEKLWLEATKEQRATWLADPSFKLMRKPKEGEAPGRLFLSILRFVLGGESRG